MTPVLVTPLGWGHVTDMHGAIANTYSRFGPRYGVDITRVDGTRYRYPEFHNERDAAAYLTAQLTKENR